MDVGPKWKEQMKALISRIGMIPSTSKKASPYKYQYKNQRYGYEDQTRA
jgi:hypothetical protein